MSSILSPHMLEMFNRRFWLMFIIAFTFLNCIIFAYFSTHSGITNRLIDPSHGTLLGPAAKTKPLIRYYVHAKLEGNSHKLLDFDDIPTDVDRSEDRMKKKKFLKLRKLFEDKCLQDENLCEDLNEFLKNASIMMTDERRRKHSYKLKSSVAVRKGEHRNIPGALIIGAKKAGTRALLSFLCLHPLVKAAGPEVHFFDRFFYRGLSWYREQLPKRNMSELLIEKTPAYFVDKDVPRRVAQTLPNIKLLLVVRDPVIRAISDYTQGLSNHGLRHTFEDIAFKNASTGLVNVAWGPIRGGLYSKHFQRWRKHFTLEKIHVVSGENLIHNPAQELKKVQDFLGLEVLVDEANFYYNATKGFPCIVTKHGRHCLGFSKGRSHPNVSADAVQILRDFYRPFNQKFYKLVGKDFGWL